MASITIRNLDEKTKQALRERAARHGRSMEEELRVMLGVMAGAGVPEIDAEPRVAAMPASDQSESAAEHGDAVTGNTLEGKRVLLLIGGGIAAYKTLDLIRRLRERGAKVRAAMSRAAQEFITPLSVGAITGDTVFCDLFDRDAEHDVGHIRLSREADLLVVAPATADLMAKLAQGHANDLLSTVLLATDKPVLLAPAMNPKMWSHPATQRNLATLIADGNRFIGPNSGEMAESGEAGSGRMAEPMQIVDQVSHLLALKKPAGPLTGHKVVITSGPTHEPIDPVRYIANRSSGKQGHAIAAALADAGADVTLVSGPVEIASPKNVKTVAVQTAREMLEAVEESLPADIAIMVAAVADWRSEAEASQKMKKKNGKGPGSLNLVENPDILKTVGGHKKRPYLVIGFAAETENLIDNARKKLKSKKADWIVANDVSPKDGVMGGDRNKIKLLNRAGVVEWPELDKRQVAERLVDEIVSHFEKETVNL